MENSQVIDLTEKPFRVGHWIVAPDRHEWRAGDDVRRVQPRLMLLLRCLARAAGKTVSRESLLDIVWERRVLNDEVLSRSIADLRQALDDDAREPRFIKTIPKLGYCLLAELEFNLPEESLTLSEPQAGHEPLGQIEQRLVEQLGSESAPVAPGDSLSFESVPSANYEPTQSHAKARSGFWLAALFATAMLMLAGWLGRGLLLAPNLPDATSEAAVLLPGAAELLLAQPLTSSPELEMSPRFSPDGQWIAYSIAVPSHPGSHIVLRSRDGTVQRQFTQSGADGVSDLCPVFVGADLIWTRHERGSCQLLRQALLADTPHVLGACAKVLSCPDVSRDAQYLAYTTEPIDGEHGYGLAALNLQSGESWALSAPPLNARADIDPRFSTPTKLSFVRGEVGAQSLWQISISQPKASALNLPLTQPQRVPLADSMVFGHAYLPDGRVLLASDALGFRALLTLALDQPIDANNPKLLGARGARYPDVAADGSVVYEVASYDANLWLYQGDAKPERLTASSRYESYPVLSADGKSVIYQSNQRGLDAIFSIRLDQAKRNQQQLPLDGESRWGHPAFAQGNDDLWLTRYDAEHSQIWRYRPSAQTAQPAPGFPSGAHAAADDATDGASRGSVWFLQGDSKTKHLMRRAPNIDDAELVARDVLSYRIHARGLFLIYQSTQDQLWHCPMPTDMASCSRLPLTVARGFTRHWALSNNGLYFVARNTNGPWLSRYDFASQRIERLTVPAPSTPAMGLAVAADESSIIVAQLDDFALDLHAWLAPKR